MNISNGIKIRGVHDKCNKKLTAREWRYIGQENQEVVYQKWHAHKCEKKTKKGMINPSP